MFEKFFKSPEISRDNIESKKRRIIKELNKQNIECDEVIESNGFSRRDFLKLVGSIASVLAIGKHKNFIKAPEHFVERENNEAAIDTEEISFDFVRENGEIVERDEARPINFSLDKPIKVSIEDIEMAKNYWKGRYAQGDLKNDFDAGVERMKPFLPKIKKIFKSNGVSEKFALIALPESFFRESEKSKKGAVGTYQLTASTARKYGLKINEKVDERTSVLKSADAASKCISDLLAVSKNPYIAVSGYNGSFMWDYPNLKRKFSIDIYLDHLSTGPEKIRQTVKYKPHIDKKVIKGETLFEIAKIYDVDIIDLKKVNNKKNDLIKIGEVLKIPLRDREQRRHVLDVELTGYKENFDFMPKVGATVEIAKERGLV